jgi:hypothetical protein
LISLLGEFYGYTPQYCLHKLTVGQALTLIEVKNDRERRANEFAKKQQDPKFKREDWEHQYDVNGPVDDLPTVEDVRSIFAGMK